MYKSIKWTRPVEFIPYDVLLTLAPRCWAVQPTFNNYWTKYSHYDKPKLTKYPGLDAGFFNCVGPFYEESEVDKFIREMNK